MGGYVNPGIGPQRSRSIADLILRRGDIAAQRAARSGDIWANALAGLGQTIGGAVQQYGEQKEFDKRSEALTQLATSEIWVQDPQAGMAAAVKVLGPQEGVKFARGIMATAEVAQKPDPGVAQKNLPVIAQGWMAAPPETRQQLWGPLRQTMLGAQLGTEQDWPEQWSEEFAPQVEAIAKQYAPEEEGPKVGSDEWLASADPAEIEALRERRGILSPHNAEEYTLSPGSVRMRGDEVLARGADPISGEAPVAVMGPDGKAVYVPRSRALGMRPANIREQGRPVVSGDAGRVSEMDDALGDIGVLTGELSENKATGTLAKLGASTPNFITELFGTGAEAKQKQAYIDRVKQVIGKALEGGVLRKEDEEKYKKILPTIGDVPSVVTAKLGGLREAILRKRRNFLDSLSDAGYDTSRYEQRIESGGDESQSVGRYKIVSVE